MIGIDSSYIGSTAIFSSDNIIANPITAPWSSATIPSSTVVGYNTAIPINPSLPLNPGGYWLLMN